MAALCTSTWGDPTATSHVLLIHGILGSSQVWHHVAHAFASLGYFVRAPDLLGHEELRPLFTTSKGDEHPYDIVVGHSLGGVVASALLPLLKSTRPVRVVLVDPPLEQTPESHAFHRKVFGDVARNPKTPEGYLEELPFLTREDAIFCSLSTHLCDAAAVEAIFDQNMPWSFLHQLSTVPDNVRMTVLAADPAKAPCVRVEELKPYPYVTAKTVWGASHMIPFEVPHVVVEAALEAHN